MQKKAVALRTRKEIRLIEEMRRIEDEGKKSDGKSKECRDLQEEAHQQEENHENGSEERAVIPKGREMERLSMTRKTGLEQSKEKLADEKENLTPIQELEGGWKGASPSRSGTGEREGFASRTSVEKKEQDTRAAVTVLEGLRFGSTPTAPRPKRNSLHDLPSQKPSSVGTGRKKGDNWGDWF
jgi:hypothetical protein